MSADVLIVVPTLGERLEFLRQTLSSIRGQGVAVDTVVVVPSEREEARALAREFGAAIVDDPGTLTTAINLGVAQASDWHSYVNWIGDDDLLVAGSIDRTRRALQETPDAVLSYGACSYIDDTGRALWVSRAGRWAQWLLPWGPDLIPQPGMLVRREAWEVVGGLDEDLRFAFDLDLLLRLRALGGFVDVGDIVASFRWHPDSLTVSDRTASLDEAELVKRRYLSPAARRCSWIWEKPVRGATRLAAREVTRRAQRQLG